MQDIVDHDSVDALAASAAPMQLFAEWLAAFKGPDHPKKEVPMCLSTVEMPATAQDMPRPTSRIVLLKRFEHGRFTFYTNYDSRKGRNLAQNPHCALNFFWGERQVRVEGRVERATPAESDAYFAYRPRASQIGAWASMQSRTMAGGAEELAARVTEMEARFAGSDSVPRPHNWGGFHVQPERIEFWQAHPYRLHQRQLYTRDVHTGKWSQPEVLYP